MKKLTISISKGVKKTPEEKSSGTPVKRGSEGEIMDRRPILFNA